MVAQSARGLDWPRVRTSTFALVNPEHLGHTPALGMPHQVVRCLPKLASLEFALSLRACGGHAAPHVLLDQRNERKGRRIAMKFASEGLVAGLTEFKRAIRAADEDRKPLARCRSEELDEMWRNF